jgi:hypothetical protein
MLRRSLFAISLLCCAASARAQNIRQDLFQTNGAVQAVATAGNLLYIGGDFTYVGSYCGRGVPLDVTTGSPVEPFPKVIGLINVAVSDGTGGVYIGGQFTSVGGFPRTGLAHILSDHSVSTWNPNITMPGGYIDAIALSGSTMYIAVLVR